MADALTDDELLVIRSWVGAKVTDDQLQERLDRLEPIIGDRDSSMQPLVEEELRYQLAVMTQDRPSSSAAEGLSQSWAANISALERRLADLLAHGLNPTGTTVGPNVTSLVRSDVR